MVMLRNPTVRRILTIVGTLVGVSVFVFIMLRIVPGDQITASLGTESAALTPEQRAELERYYGLDRPYVVQYFEWLGRVLIGNLGYSARAGESVANLTLSALPVTLELAILSILFALVLGVTLGSLAAFRQGRLPDAVGQIVSMTGLSVPVFFMGASLLALGAYVFRFNPNGMAYRSFFEDPLINLQQMFLPALVLGFNVAAPILRTTRAAILEIEPSDFVRTAHAKGLGRSRVQIDHVLRNALVPIVTMTGLQFGYLLGGAVVVESIFALPGLGRQVLLAVEHKEYAVAQSTILVIAAGFVLVNLATDLVYRVIDPRVASS